MSTKSMTVGKRLALSFGSICVLLMITVGIGISSLSSLNSDTGTIVNDRWPKISMSSDILAQTNTIAIAVRSMMLTSSKDERDKQVEVIMQARKVAQARIDSLEKVITLPKGKELLRELTEVRAKYVERLDRLLVLIKEDKADEARTYLANELRPVLADYQQAIANMIKFQVELIETSGKQAEDTYRDARLLMLALGACALLLSAAIGFLMTRYLMQKLGGEPDYAAGIAQRIAEGDLTVHVELRHGDTSSMLHAMRTMRDNLANIVAQVRQGTDTIVTASTQIASGNLDLSSRTEEQASSLEETASSMEELTSTVKQNADNARQANSLASTASEVADRGGAVVAQVVETMGSINDSSRKIVDIISVIDGIAFQTNILALNAAVEAARAGEQGRGFAVVASEVRNLAQRSASAAKEIKALIDDSVDKVETGAQLVEQAGATMTEIMESVKRVTDIMGEITAASAEQTSGIEQINQAISQMDEATQQNASLVEQAAAAAEAMQDQASQLVGLVSTFRTDGTGGAVQLAVAPARAAAQGVHSPAIAPRKAAPVKTRMPAPAAKRPLVPHAAAGGDWEEF
ncbi:MAG TPA: methyl-accepting chemotaxis protein [Noviherbaspirillum sp.]|uniref:methyl-accepting chemotaxis protein n=1 Tax=Noviherbaspirillum sp. TaxID=1926288 RepID=UPI002D4F7223|nr:methyl-accepting chemotaxis protein [Noviherbaspirillum sp.]HYD93986.1 methyl-accepting chemotaxis protein [Noviherbaspirillum sp.]